MTTQTKPKEKIHDPDIARRFMTFRTKHVDKSQNKAAVKLGVGQSKLSLIENGYETPNFKIMNTLVTKYLLNTEWLSTGLGQERIKVPAKASLVTDIGKLNEEMLALKKYIKILEANQDHFLKRLDRLEKQLSK